MKVNWFSPLQPAPTDIAHYTARVLPPLLERAEVALWTDQPEWDKDLDRLVQVRQYHPGRMPWRDINRADLTIYSIGNNPRFHGSIWQVSRRHSGIVILHDFRLHHFFDGLYREQWHDGRAYLAEMEFHYGPEARRDAEECYDTDARNIDYMAERYPFTPLALRNALGVVVHTGDALQDLKRADLPPVVYLPLPFPPGQRNRKSWTQTPVPIKGSYCRLIVFGYIGRNRRLDDVLEALAGLQERERFRLDIYGQLLYREAVEERIRSLQLGKLVKLHGLVSEAKLDDALSKSHLAINLRNPTMGEASGSQLRIWAHSLPGVVSRTGWYGTLPSDAVVFVRTGYEVEDLRTILLKFLAGPAEFSKIGVRGRQILEEEHSPAAYAQGVIDFADRVRGLRPRVAGCRLAERAGAIVGLWEGNVSATETTRRLASTIYQLVEESG
jgi:glycosyltransferase involved in cell wall biosynthesis